MNEELVYYGSNNQKLYEVIDGKVQNEKESLIKHLKDNRREKYGL